ncbi:hypothetical protein ACPOL_4391 [Acidisarcina polymorpha]|uniref:Adhesin domain-containing protein n=1 Tax=Acidisarcina polymorpha TaxID=2211140 RepID=A0A2Z5G4B0_9BACT|nr:DUF4097 family beta strand repeat-containing protein [Acidisarcina polymorpha]AXC13664.1 hypothetical protein ACPOL_4391 [Acidisarcina polymorpha]
MAASPPPYPPSSQDPRQQKAYWRAQKEAYRSQKDLWRAQRRDQRYYWQSMHRPSIVGPVVLLAIGIVALLITSGRLNAPYFWDWFLRWWPVLLVGVGMVSLLEWFLDRDQPYRRKSGTFGIVLLISILVGIAYSQDHVHRLAEGFGVEGDKGWPNFMGNDHDHDADSSVSIPSNASVEVQNPRGDVTVTGSGDNQLHVHAHQVVNTNSDSDAERTFPALNPHVTVNGNNVLVKIESRNNGHADLTIEMPQGASADITAGRGDVSIDGLRGNSNVIANRGDVKLSSIGGSAHVHMNKGDFSAHEIGGPVSLDGHFGDVTISEVTGNLSMDGEFFGDTHLEQIASPLHFHSSRTDMEVARLAGDLTMDSDDLHIGQSVGPLRIVTHSKNIECSQISGDIHIENANGEVSVTAVEPLGNIQITNASDPVNLTLPPNASFSMNATTNGGDLNSDFNLNVNGSDQHRTATGDVGKGGPRIELNVRHGDISIKKGDFNPPPLPPMPRMPVMPAMPKTPALPKVPAPPSGPVRHLHASDGENPDSKIL